MHLPRMLAALLLMLMLAAFPAAPAQAAAIGVTTIDDELNSDGDCSLREAIRAANLNTTVDACPAGDGADTIALPAGIYALTISGNNDNAALTGDLDITGALTITGALSTTTVIDGGALNLGGTRDQVIDIRGGNVTLSGLTVRNGTSGGIVNQASGTLTLTQSLIANNAGTGLYNHGRAQISGSTFTHNRASFSSQDIGGGIYNIGTLLLTNSAVISNTADRGGGIANYNVLTVTHSLVSENFAFANGIFSERGIGGGIINFGSQLFVEHSMVVRNRSQRNGGGIYNWAKARIVNTTIADNIAKGANDSRGAGIQNDENGLMTITASLLKGNTAESSGGGIMAFGRVTIDQTTIVSNTSELGGSGLLSAGFVTVTNSLISGNTGQQGAGIAHIRLNTDSLLVLAGTTIRANAAVRGGGIYAASRVQIMGSAIISNTATEDGGGIYGGDGYSTHVLTVTNTTISGNSAARHGGGLYSITGTLRLYNDTVAYNIADSDNNGTGDGGGVMRSSGTVALQNSILGANTDRGGQADDCAGTLLSQGYNLLQDTSGCTLAGTGDISGQPPLLGPLANNGGPTPTHALLPDSPAINAGDPAGCRDAQGILLASDQRGQPRPQSGACDIGAFESALTPQIATTTTLSSSGSPTSVGQTIIFTAIVSATAGTPGGSVIFKDGATILGSVALVGGQASFNSAALAVGQHNITAAYSGDATFQASVSPALTQQVDKLGSAVALDASASPSAFGQTVTFTATVQLGASGTPTGTVTFRDGVTLLGSSRVDNDGRASFSTALLALGQHSITAEYSGDASFLGSVSSPLAHQIDKASATIAITASAQPSLVGQTLVFTITVGTDGMGTPGGTVTLKDGATVLGSGALVGGLYVFTTAALAPGEHQITVEYSGDTQFEPATSSALAHTVLVPVYLSLIAGM